MHRSGTSAIARILNMMGAYFAPERMELPATDANPKGYWERRDVINLNEEIFTHLGVSWDKTIQFSPEQLDDALTEKFGSLARDIILGLDAHRPWMLKDPRLCLLLPFWQQYCEIPVHIIVYRNPIQVAQSLQNREGFSLQLGTALWEYYNLSTLQQTQGLPRLLVSYHDLMHDPVATVNHLYQQLNELSVQGLRLPQEKEILAFLSPDLHHAHGDTTLQSAYINHQQQTLVDAFEQKTILTFNDIPQLSAGAAETLETYEAHCNTVKKLRQTQEKQQFLHTETIAELKNNQAEELAKLTATHQRELVDVTVKKEQALKQAQQKSQVLESKSQVLESKSQVLESKSQALENKIQALEKQYNDDKNQLSSLLSTEKEKQSTLHRQLEDKESHLRQLNQWLNGLSVDIQSIFNSFTWKSGNILTQTILKLLFKQAGRTAKDHIEETLIAVAQYSPNSSAIPPSPAASSPTSTPAAPQSAPPMSTMGTRDYATWIKNYDSLTKKQVKRLEKNYQAWPYQPLISIIFPTYNTPENYLREALDSVCQQIYPHWELCIADDASTQPHVKTVLEEYAAKDSRIKVTFRSENGHISAASNSALELTTGDFIAFLDHDDTLAPHALYWVAEDMQNYPDACLWYSDEDKLDTSGQRCDPYFKSDWNPDLFLSHNLITHLAVYKASLIQELEGLREGYEGAQDYDLVLRVIDQITPAQIRHIPRILYHWRVLEGSTASNPEQKPYAIIAAEKAIQNYLDRNDIAATVTESPLVSGTLRVRYHLPSTPPLVSLIIPTYNGYDILKTCIDSILEKTDYPNYEILIIDNNSDDPATLEYMEILETEGKARIIDYPYPFNYADMNNKAVEYAQGEIIGLLNNDLEVINTGWLTEMVSHAVRPEVGIVGARLWYPNNTLQHAGVLIGIGGSAGHAHKGFDSASLGYCGRAALIQNYSAVTGACMLMRKPCFYAAGGLNAEHLKVALNDVDLCLKMNQLNLRVVWTPYAELYHHESISRGYEDTPEKKARYEGEKAYMREHWGAFFANDPAYSPNLTLDAEDFSYAWPPRVPLV